MLTAMQTTYLASNQRPRSYKAEENVDLMLPASDIGTCAREDMYTGALDVLKMSENSEGTRFVAAITVNTALCGDDKNIILEIVETVADQIISKPEDSPLMSLYSAKKHIDLAQVLTEINKFSLALLGK